MSCGTGIKNAGGDISEVFQQQLEENYDYHIFIVTDRSRTVIEETIRMYGLTDDKYLFVNVQNEMQNIGKLFYKILKVVRKLQKDEDYSFVADFTSGTKPMSAATAFVGVVMNAQKIHYAVGRRENTGIAQTTDGLETIKAKVITNYLDALKVIDFIKILNFSAAESIIRGLSSDDIISKEELESIKIAAKLYSHWEKFDYTAVQKYAAALLEKRDILKNGNLFFDEVLPKNEKQLRFLSSFNEKNAKFQNYVIVDLFLNGCRRIKTGAYNDAVIRFYAVMEHIIKCKLLEKNIDNSNIEISNLTNEVIEKFYEKTGQKLKGKDKIGLTKSGILLDLLGDDAGVKIVYSKEFKKIMNKRNHLVLTHGWQIVKKEDAEAWQNFTYNVLQNSFSDDLEHIIESLLHPFLKRNDYPFS